MGAATSGISSDRLLVLLRAYRVPAVCLFVANAANSVSLALAGITLTYVVKASIPVFTVAVRRVLYHEKFSWAIYLSLAPACLGIALASIAQDHSKGLSLGGLAAALTSTVAQTALNMTSKAAASATGAHPVEAFFAMTTFCAICSIPLQLSLNPTGVLLTDLYTLRLTLLAMLAYYCEYQLNFAVVARLSPVTFSVADIGRRLAIIVAGSIFFYKRLTLLNMLGAGLAFTGVSCYTWLHHAEKRHSLIHGADDDSPVSPGHALPVC